VLSTLYDINDGMTGHAQDLLAAEKRPINADAEIEELRSVGGYWIGIV
jgi:hypothetical protein